MSTLPRRRPLPPAQSDRSLRLPPVFSELIRFNHQNSQFRREVDRENVKIRHKILELRTRDGVYGVRDDSLKVVNDLRGRIAFQHHQRRKLEQERVDHDNFRLYRNIQNAKSRYL